MEKLDDHVRTRFYPHQQAQELKEFKGFPSQIRYNEVLISQGVEHLVKHYDAKWIIERYKKLMANRRYPKLVASRFLTHELISAPMFDIFRLVITDGQEVIYERKYEHIPIRNPSFVMYSVGGFFMLPTEYEAYSQVNP
jgi:hypothetical protein